MFGYLTADERALSPEGVARYRKFYCGLCRALDKEYGSAGRAVLTYDMTFTAILLSSLYALHETGCKKHCILHPFSDGAFLSSPAILYAADMNILLAYYQSLDDWHDDRNLAAFMKHRSLRRAFEKASLRQPRQSAVIKARMDQLSAMEAANVLNPDLPANCFGELLAEVFIMEEDGYMPVLRRMGAALGRFIYLLDARNDLRADIRKKRYNPLVAYSGTDIDAVLTLHIGECAAEFESLSLTRDAEILQNVIYCGVWRRRNVNHG